MTATKVKTKALTKEEAAEKEETYSGYRVLEKVIASQGYTY